MNLPAILLGRILLALPFLVFGLLHFSAGAQMAGMVPTWIPGGVLWVYLTGVANVLAAVAFLTGKKVKLAGQLTALMVLGFILTIHLPGVMNATDDMSRQISMTMLLKDFGLMAGALLLAHIYGDKE